MKRNRLYSSIYALTLASCLVLGRPLLHAQPSTQYGDNFDAYTAGAQPGGFAFGKNGSVNTHSYTINGAGADKQLRAVVNNQSFAGGGISSAIRSVPYIGGLNQKGFTLTSTMKVVTAPSSYNLSLVALAGSQPIVLGSYYRASISNTGVPAINSSNGGTTGLVLGTATNLSSGLVAGTTYTFTLKGTYSGGALSLAFTVTDGTNTASLSATAATPLTGTNCGYELKVNPAGGSITADIDSFRADVPMSFTQVWGDEFSGTALDTTVWSTGYRWSGVINNELQAMRPENVSVGNGVLHIDVTNPAAPVKNRDMTGYEWGAFDYASGAVQTYNKWTKTYGYFEARIKMPTGKGTWPAFWLLPDRGPTVTNLTNRVEVGDNGYGRGSEIDVTEYMAAWTDPVTALSNSHSGLIWSYASGGGTAQGSYALANEGAGPMLEYPTAETGFHTYGVYWEPGIVTFYLDGKVVYSVHNATYVPNVPEHLLLNASITQNDWHGNTIPFADIAAGMPCFMEVDYVRVYDVNPGAPSSRVPLADAYVRDGSYQNTNYGTATTLGVKADVASYNREAYLKFDVTGLAAAPTVTLRMVPTSVGADPATLRFDFVTSDTWTESGLKWTNKPASSGVVLGTVPGPFTIGQPIDVDVTSQAHAAASGDGLLSIRVLSTVAGSNRAVELGARENSTTAYQPILLY